MRHTILILAIATLTTLAPLGLAQGVVPNAVVNGDFELYLPDQSEGPLAGTPVDECIGIGHQALFGYETVPGTLAGGTYDDPQPSQADPQTAADNITSDPQGEALFLTGYGHCVSNAEEGYDAAWLNPVRTAGDDALQWSQQNAAFADHDGDGDREALIPHGGPGHNLWQSIAQPFQGFTPNAEAFEFDLEAGGIASNAKVVLSMSATPMEAQSPWVGVYFDCQLTLGSSQLTDGLDDGHVSVDPTDGQFRSRSADCDQAKADWDTAKEDGDEDALRDVLGRLRIGQMSFWGFQQAAEDPACTCAAQIDNVSLTEATTVAEEIAAGNIKAQPAPSVFQELPE